MSAAQRPAPPGFDWPQPGVPLAIVDVCDGEETSRALRKRKRDAAAAGASSAGGGAISTGGGAISTGGDAISSDGGASSGASHS